MDLHDIRRPVHNEIRFLLAVRRAEDNRLEDSNSRGTIQVKAMSVGDLQPPLRGSVRLSRSWFRSTSSIFPWDFVPLLWINPISPPVHPRADAASFLVRMSRKSFALPCVTSLG